MSQKEILFEKEIDINATIKNLEKLSFGSRFDWHSFYKVLVFEEEKSYQEIKNKMREYSRHSNLRLVKYWLIGIGLILGLAFGNIITNIIHGSIPFGSFLFLIFILIICLIFCLFMVPQRKNLAKWIYFPTRNSGVLIGNFSEEEINTFKHLVVFRKSKVKRKIEKK